jgi:hypothetical protein
MVIPPGMTEEQVLAAIEKVVLSLSSKFVFGYYDREDMKQEARYEAVKLINAGKYDPKRPLENFLYTHVRNRLINLKRNKYKRYEPPCITCPFYDKLCKKSVNQCAEFEDKMHCKKYASWVQRNKVKQGLMHPVDISSIFDERLSQNKCVMREVEYREIVQIIESRLPTSLLPIWNRAKDGDKLRKSEREKLQKHILRIMGAEANGGN